MTTAAKFMLASSLAVVASFSTGCDSDMAASPMDYRTVAHLELGTMGSTPWIKTVIDTKSLDLDGDLGPCADLVHTAKAVTIGHGEAGFELYVQGKFDATKADACTDHIEKMVDKHEKKSGEPKPDPEGVVLAADLFAVYAGTMSPSRKRLKSLLASDPSPGGQSMWVVAQPDVKHGDNPVAYIQAWADTSKGLNAHAEVQMADETVATELYGKAMLGVTALQLSGEADEVAKGISLAHNGDTLTADFKAQPKILQKLFKDGASKRAKAKGKGKGKGGPPHKRGDGEHSISFTFGSE